MYVAWNSSKSYFKIHFLPHRKHTASELQWLTLFRVIIPVTESIYLSISICQWLYSPLLGVGSFFGFLILYTVGRTPWTWDQPVARPLPIHRTIQTQNKRTQTFMPRMGFEPTTPVFERAKTVLDLDCAAAVIGLLWEAYVTYKYALWAKLRIFLILKKIYLSLLLLGLRVRHDASLHAHTSVNLFTPVHLVHSLCSGLHRMSVDPVLPSGFVSQYQLSGPRLAIRNVSVVFLSSCKYMSGLKLTIVHEPSLHVSPNLSFIIALLFDATCSNQVRKRQTNAPLSLSLMLRPTVKLHSCVITRPCFCQLPFLETHK
jgi:hypothetical protein